MPAYPLLPDKQVAATGVPGVLAGLSLDPAWSPKPVPAHPPTDVRHPATSYPTPFHRMESIRVSLARGADPQIRLWEIGVRALACGLLRVERVDLRSEGGAFGRCLLGLDPERRHLALLMGKLPNNTEVVFAVSDHEVLLWPAARRTQAEWDHLEHELNSTDRGELALLASLRELMRKANEWSTTIAWMAALDRLLGARTASDVSAEYTERARGVGPLPMQMWADDAPRMAPMYFPVVAQASGGETWGALMRRMATLDFAVVEGSVIASDARRVAQLRVELPAGGDGGAYAGAGIVHEIGQQAPMWPSADTLTLERPNGVFATLGPLLYGNQPLDVEHIRIAPYRYADPVRVLVAALGSSGLPRNCRAHNALAYGHGALLGALSRDAVPLPDARDLTNDASLGFIHYQPSGGGQVYANTFTHPHATELRNIGWVLWSVFQGRGVVDGRLGSGDAPAIKVDDVAALQDAGGRLQVLAVDELTDDLKQQVGARTATLQRFAKAWALDGAPRVSGTTARELLQAAAAAWVRWATEQSPFPNGSAPESQVSWRVFQDNVSLPVDA